MWLNWVAILAVVILWGCAFTSQAVVISPKLDVPVSELGANHAINLNVVDERPRQTLGTRGVRGVGADLTVEGDLQSVVQSPLTDGLAKQSFKPLLGSNSEGRELRVEIRNLDYTIIQGFWVGTLRIDVRLKAICIHGLHRPYEQLHRGEVVRRLMVVQGAEANNSHISQAVSGAVNSRLKDQKLLACLSE